MVVVQTGLPKLTYKLKTPVSLSQILEKERHELRGWELALVSKWSRRWSRQVFGV